MRITCIDGLPSSGLRFACELHVTFTDAEVENLFARCKQFRSLATRYDKRAASYRALWLMAFAILSIQHAH